MDAQQIYRERLDCIDELNVSDATRETMIDLAQEIMDNMMSLRASAEQLDRRIGLVSFAGKVKNVRS